MLAPSSKVRFERALPEVSRVPHFWAAASMSPDLASYQSERETLHKRRDTGLQCFWPKKKTGRCSGKNPDDSAGTPRA